eukprot:796440-Rhodomonas_salina.1
MQRASLQDLHWQLFKTSKPAMLQDLQHFIDFEHATAATFYFQLCQFQTCDSSNLLLSNTSLISNMQQQQPSTFSFVNFKR